MRRHIDLDDRDWEKNHERGRADALAHFQAEWGAEVPAEATPYLHTLRSPGELRQLVEALAEVMTRPQLVRLMPRLERLYGRSFVRRSGAPAAYPPLGVAS